MVFFSNIYILGGISHNPMKLPQNPHDRLFKSLFSDKKITADYLQNFLPADLIQKLSLDSLEMDSNSFITPELEEFYSDIVYHCKMGEQEISISLLFEHKSNVPKYPHLQLLKYMLAMWDYQLQNKIPLQAVIPIIVYHGRKKWRIRALSSYFGRINEALLPFIPEFTYHLTDLNQWSEEALLQLRAGLVINAFLLLKFHVDRKDLEKVISTIV